MYEALAAGIIKRKRSFLISYLKYDFPTQDNIIKDLNRGYRFFLARKKKIYIVIDIIITLCIYSTFQVIIIIINLYLQFLIVYNTNHALRLEEVGSLNDTSRK